MHFLRPLPSILDTTLLDWKKVLFSRCGSRRRISFILRTFAKYNSNPERSTGHRLGFFYIENTMGKPKSRATISSRGLWTVGPWIIFLFQQDYVVKTYCNLWRKRILWSVGDQTSPSCTNSSFSISFMCQIMNDFTLHTIYFLWRCIITTLLCAKQKKF